MATKTVQARCNDLPEAIYLNKNRYWWKVQLPGESKPNARPLVNPGSKFATTDYSAAVDLAQNLYQQSIYQSQNLQQGFAVSNIASLVKAYLAYAEQYYRVLFFANRIRKMPTSQVDRKQGYFPHPNNLQGPRHIERNPGMQRHLTPARFANPLFCCDGALGDRPSNNSQKRLAIS